MANKGKGMKGESYAVPAKKLDKIEAKEGAGKMGYAQKFGPGRASGYDKGAMKAMDVMSYGGASKYMGEGPGQGFFANLKKAGRTITRGAGDIGMQILDMMQPDVQHIGNGGGRMSNVGTGLGTASQAKRDARRMKKIENDQYARSRQLANEGKTFGTLADYFDDDGKGNAITTKNDSSRGR